MKFPWPGLVLASVVITAAGLWLNGRSDSPEQRALNETRRKLKEAGFKTDLDQFDFSTSAETRARVDHLTNNIAAARGSGAAATRYAQFQQAQLERLLLVSSNSALVVWKQQKWRNVEPFFTTAGLTADDIWPGLRDYLQEMQEPLDAAAQAAVGGPIRFHLRASAGYGLLLPHLAGLKSFEGLLGRRTILELHDKRWDAAWTNVLATTRLVTGFSPEATEISHLVRFACTTLAFNTLWQALQSRTWSEEQLARLQREWESVEFFRDLPETAAFARAGVASLCQGERLEPLNLGLPFIELIRAPRTFWSAVASYRSQLKYRQHGSYEDEKDVLLHFQQREIELRRAVEAPSWAAMSALPGVTNLISFVSKHRSRLQMLLNIRQITLASQIYGSPGRGSSFLSRAADSESRRRLIVAALALERFRLRHNSYPDGLPKVVPEFLAAPPIDFMDGQPLRYVRLENGSFVLYSVGFDCVDNHGTGRIPGILQRSELQPVPSTGSRPGTDLVWPQAASSAEISTFEKEQEEAKRAQQRTTRENAANWHWTGTADRQREVEKILARKPIGAIDPKIHGRRLSELLRLSGDTRPMSELLMLDQQITGEEPEILTFQIPIRYSALTNLGDLYLFLDPLDYEVFDGGCFATLAETLPATNGKCLLKWHTFFDAPGKHALQAGLILNDVDDLAVRKTEQKDHLVLGPFTSVTITNLCQFTPDSATFAPGESATLRARLPEEKGDFVADFSSEAGEHLKRFAGSTTNGMIVIDWDLIDERGRRCTNSSFNSFFHITLPESRRSQTVRGP
jgi:hypothetical protein